ncbi:hypothetical protein SRIMR7_03505 [Streptomyces rimosus subsp. rimosus]|uniref:Uncharacterized protein n=1 Tax=Streptomyces rimosus subsp. rimosus TaxID=132474 RepID=A0ABY3YTX4_STRRM|nr:hypothetical protein SRIMR7_03505 [Streptomyces rimosus subsp. rimosus]
MVQRQPGTGSRLQRGTGTDRRQSLGTALAFGSDAHARRIRRGLHCPAATVAGLSRLALSPCVGADGTSYTPRRAAVGVCRDQASLRRRGAARWIRMSRQCSSSSRRFSSLAGSPRSRVGPFFVTRPPVPESAALAAVQPPPPYPDCSKQRCSVDHDHGLSGDIGAVPRLRPRGHRRSDGTGCRAGWRVRRGGTWSAKARNNVSMASRGRAWSTTPASTAACGIPGKSAVATDVCSWVLCRAGISSSGQLGRSCRCGNYKAGGHAPASTPPRTVRCRAGSEPGPHTPHDFEASLVSLF